MKYHDIYVALDGSRLSSAAAGYALLIGQTDGATLHGSHVYAARLHEQRFKMMEGGLPEPYREEDTLESQRQVHDSLITKGLELISDSYLTDLEASCKDADVPFSGISLEGKNWKELVRSIHAGDYDLVVIGAHGVGRVAATLLGTVAERVLRRVRRDVLICKKDPGDNESDLILVCLDGSARSWGALQRGMALAGALGKRLTAVSCFDPHFHYAMFNSINRVLTDEARNVFKFEEQEKLHEDIIDSGLARMYQSYLDVAQRIGAQAGFEVSTRLLAGKAYPEILNVIVETSPWLTIVGRIGGHSDEEMDIGGNTENICRMADCNMLVVDTKFTPPDDVLADAMVTWTKEAVARLETIAPVSRACVAKAVRAYCLASSHTVVTSSIVDEALDRVSAAEALDGGNGGRGTRDPGTAGRMSASDPSPERKDGPLWTDAAVERVERVPQGFMRSAATMAIEQFARDGRFSEITLEVAEAGLEKARARMTSARGNTARRRP